MYVYGRKIVENIHTPGTLPVFGTWASIVLISLPLVYVSIQDLALRSTRSLLSPSTDHTTYIAIGICSHTVVNCKPVFDTPKMHIRLILSLVLIQHAASMVIPLLDGVGLGSLFNRDDASSNKPGNLKPRNGPAPLFRVSNAVTNRYIVVYNDEVTEEDVSSHNSWISSVAEKRDLTNEQDDDRKIEFFGLPHFRGYLGWFPENILKSIQDSPQIKYIEQDARVHMYDTSYQDDATWGLTRLSERGDNGSSDAFVYDSEAGSGVVAYVLDTGVRAWDGDFEGRAKYHKALAFPGIPVDMHGHGTHVAGTVGSKTWGVAKKVEIVGVGVLGPFGTGMNSDIIRGIEYAVKGHEENVKKSKKGFRGTAINLSIGGSALGALDAAVNAAIDAGVHVVAAAGNDNLDACDFSPSRADRVITVGAVDENDQKASFSNYGKCIDIHAPGVDIESVGLSTSPTLMSGTSMAAPHVTGLIAYFLSLQPGLGSEFSGELVDPAEMKSRLLDYGTKNVLKGLSSDTVNLMAYNGAEDATEIWA